MLSLCMIVKDEEQNLARCLRSVENCVDEMIIVDTGSKDDTINIARQFGARVYTYRWDDNFAAARNYSLEKAGGDWIIYLDADEELEPHCSDRLRALTERSGVEGYFFQINNLSDRNTILRHINLRMFRNRPGYRFQGLLHEQILSPILESNPGAVVVNSGINIFHYGYLSSALTAKNKTERNYRINKRMVAQEPKNPFYLYSLGNSFVNMNQLKKAAAVYRRALQYINVRANYAPSVFMAYISCLLKLGRLEEAVAQIAQCKNHYPDYVDIHYVEGELFARLEHHQRARRAFEKCLQIGEQVNGKYTTVTGTGSFLPLFQLARIYRSLGDLPQAVSCQIKALSMKNNDLSQFIALARLLKDLFKDNARVCAALCRFISIQDTVKKHLLLARLLYEIRAYDWALKLLAPLPDSDDTCYLKGLICSGLGLFERAIDCFARVGENSPLYQACRQHSILAHWLSAPPRDAHALIEPPACGDRHQYHVFKWINSKLFPHREEPAVSYDFAHLKGVVDKLLALNGTATVLRVLTLSGLDTPDRIIDFLTDGPFNRNRAALAARLALQEIKKNIHHPGYYYALARYLLGNNELNHARRMIDRAVGLNPAVPRYQHLRNQINCKNALKTIISLLAEYPDHPLYNRYLIELQKKTAETFI